jgi:hypothetical protein
MPSKTVVSKPIKKVLYGSKLAIFDNVIKTNCLYKHASFYFNL